MPRALPILALLLAAPAFGQSARTDSVFETATDAYEAGDWTVAETLLSTVLGRDRDHAGAHHLLALVYAQDGPQHDNRLARRHAEQAVETAPDDPRVLETRLRQYQRDLSEERAFSMTDGRRAGLARKILALDAESAVAHEERALAYFLEFDWRRNLALQRGGWDRAAERGLSGAANRAFGRMEEHLDAALASEPDRASAYRLLLRAHASARNDAGLLDAAQRMKAARPDDADAALFYGLALYRQGLLAAAEAQFAEALDRMPRSQRRRFEDVAGLVRKDVAVGDTAAFAERFWRSRDPRLLTPQNERRLEHFARLALTDLLFTDTFRDRRGWESVRGEVAVRYGLPVAEVSQLSHRDGRFTRWLYDDFSLLFQDTFISGDPDFWSSAEGEDEATRARSLMTRVPERFDYAPPNKLDFPLVVTAFRGENGATDLYAHFDVPTTGDSGPSSLRSGAFLIGDDYQIVSEERREAGRTSPGAVFSAETFALRAEPGSYELAVEFEKGRGGVGFERVSVEVPAYRSGRFAMSDVLLARAVEEEESEAAGSFERRGFRIAPAPSRTFATDQPIYVYAEGYGLQSVDGRARYTLAVSLTPQPSTTGLAGLARRIFGTRPRGVGVAFEGESVGGDVADYVILDASTQPPGPYLLSLRLRDLVSGEVLERTTSVFIE